MRKPGAGAHVQEVDAGVLEPAADANDVLDRVAASEPGQKLARSLVDADLEPETEVVADLGPNRTDHLEREASPVFERSSVRVLARVDRRTQELGEEHPVRTCQLDAVQSGFARAARGLCELADHIADLVDLQRAARKAVDRLGIVGRPQCDVVAEAGQDAFPPCVHELDDVLAVVLVDAPTELAPEGDPVVRVEVRIAGDDVTPLVDRSVRGDDRADATACELQVPVDPDLGARPVVVVETARDARADNAVLDGQAPQVQGLEDHGCAHGRTVRLRPPMAAPSLTAGVSTPRARL